MSLPSLLPLLPTFLLDAIQETAGNAAGAAEGGAAASDGGGSSFLLPMLAIGAIFWFVMIAPERKKRKAHDEMLGALKKGDKVMTTSGMYGSVSQVQDDVVTLQISDNVRVKFARAAIQGFVDAEARAKASAGKDAGKDDEKDKQGDIEAKADEKERETVES